MNDSVMLAFLPTNGYWCKQDLPHMTLVYCGTIDDVNVGSYNDLAKDALTVARLMARPFSLDVIGVEVYGDEEKVDVLTLGSIPKLDTARKFVGLWNKSGHGFSPHATVGPEGSAEGEIPTSLYFDRIAVCWGPKKIEFRLGGDPRDY
jgi:2'-5' RNA ligase